MTNKREYLDEEDTEEVFELFAKPVDEEHANLIKAAWALNPTSGGTPAPDGLSLDDMLVWKLNKEISARLANKLISIALKGDLKAIQYIYDRVEGKPRVSTVDVAEKEDPIVLILKDVYAGEADKENKRLAKQHVRQLDAGNEAQVREKDSEASGT